MAVSLGSLYYATQMCDLRAKRRTVTAPFAGLNLLLHALMSTVMLMMLETVVFFGGQIAILEELGKVTHIPVLLGGQITAVFGIVRDLSERRLALETAFVMANQDPLTGLPNRRLFLDRLRLELTHARRSQASLVVIPWSTTARAASWSNCRPTCASS